MDSITIALGWTGVFAPLALGCIGSAIGCGRAGQAACGAMLETESGHGKYIGVSLMPSSQAIYGIVLMFLFAAKAPITVENAPGLFGVGLLAGLALVYTSAWQGLCCAASINVSKSKPAIFGISVTPAAVIEGFSVFAFVFALYISTAIPGGQ